MDVIFDEQLQSLMETQQGEYSMTVRSINQENEEIRYTIEFIQVEDFILTANHNDPEDDYITETDYIHLLMDFANDRILEITVRNFNEDIVEHFDNGPEEIAVDYSRKTPKNMEECPICLEALIIDVCANRKCKHLYHCGCISQWTHDNCPVCRRPLDLYKIQDINDYRQTAGFTLFGNISEIKYLRKLLNVRKRGKCRKHTN